MRELHDRTRDALAACREALHAVEFEAHIRRRKLNSEQCVARYTAKESLRRVIAVMEAEREPEPDTAESNAVKRFLMEQMEQCQYPAPACSFCAAIERLLIAEGYRVEPVIPVSEGPVTGTKTVLDAEAGGHTGPRLVVVGSGESR